MSIMPILILMEPKDQINLRKYETAWSCISSAVEELESVQIGLDKELYATIEKIIHVLDGQSHLIDSVLIEPTQERSEAQRV